MIQSPSILATFFLTLIWDIKIHFRQKSCKSVLPIWQQDKTVFNQFSFAQTAVRRSRNFIHTILSRADRKNCDHQTALLVIFTAEVIPACAPILIRGMIIPIFFHFGHIDQKSVKISSVCGSANLVVDDPNGIVRFTQTNYGTNKVLALQPV